MIDEHLHNLFFEDPMIKGRLPAVMEAAVNGVVSPSQAVTELINVFDIGHSDRQDDLVMYANKDNNELIQKLNAALKDYKKSGEYKKLINFYFGDIEKQAEI